MTGDSGEDGTEDPREDVGWPLELAGVTESVTATRGPDGAWNLAALGIHAPDGGEHATARTWGRTRTRRNFEREGEGVVQFTRDPGLFVDAALGIVEREEPVHEGADAWARVAVERVGTGESGGTEWVDWRLTPVQRSVNRRTVGRIDRGLAAVVEATVAASRLDVPDYDDEVLVARLEHLREVVESCGSPDQRTAFERVDEHVGWTDR